MALECRGSEQQYSFDFFLSWFWVLAGCSDVLLRLLFPGGYSHIVVGTDQEFIGRMYLVICRRKPKLLEAGTTGTLRHICVSLLQWSVYSGHFGYGTGLHGEQRDLSLRHPQRQREKGASSWNWALEVKLQHLYHILFVRLQQVLLKFKKGELLDGRVWKYFSHHTKLSHIQALEGNHEKSHSYCKIH